ncbi:hypothetical protein [Borreliella garinii]|uniref:Uncharacterized protein n=3 Tax=Borreliella garinii TaxID=29519 RepID=B8F1V5_BORGR|nr:hypothetical protein [Borreliella garinii]ACL34876.1 conserved hypothetical protein [Borreliella garinii PBr]
MITQEDYLEIKKRLENTKTRIQFRNGNKIDSLGYEGSIGEPILLKNKLTFSVCDGKSIDNRKEYEITKSPPKLNSFKEYLEHMILFFLEKTPVGTLTYKFANAGSKLTRKKLIETFTNTNKFCIPDGRNLPSNCYASKVLGISYAPDLGGRFLRHYDPEGYTDSFGSRSLGSTQSDSLKKHQHDIDKNRINFSGNLVSRLSRIYRDANWFWSDGNTRFVTRIDLNKVHLFNFPHEKVTEYEGSQETRPKNTCYLCFYRYDI